MAVDPHILNLYEAYDLRLSEIDEIVKATLNGSLDSPIEKLDGQNLTFTVDGDGEIRFMGKGCPQKLKDAGGLTIAEVKERFTSKPNVALAYASGMMALQEAIDLHSDRFIRACRSGKRNMGAEVVTPKNSNVIKYERDAVYILGFVPHDSAEPQELIEVCGGLPIQSSHGWLVDKAPAVKFNPRSKQQQSERAWTIITQLYRLKNDLKIMGDVTVGDLCTRLLERHVHENCTFLGAHQVRSAAQRLLFEDASYLPRSNFQSKSTWEKFRAIDDDRVTFVGDALAPFEVIIQLLGTYAMESYDFTAADVSEIGTLPHREFVARVRDAWYHRRIEATPLVKQRIESILMRLDENIFTRNAEGIVFSWKGRQLKLTGAYAAINRLRGYFTYGDDPARIV